MRRIVMGTTAVGLLAVGVVATAMNASAGTAPRVGVARPALTPVRSARPAPSLARPAVSAASGAGAQVPFVQYEAERAATTGTVVGPDITPGSITSESSGRSAVRLAPGQYLDFTLTAPANAVDIAAAVTKGSAATLSATAAGSAVPGTFAVDSRWTSIQTSIAGSPRPYHFYSDYRLKLGRTVDAGGTVRVRAEAGAPVTVDLADFEQVGAPLAAPANSVSVVDLGADPTGAADSTAAFTRAIDSAAGRTVWVPEGRYRVGSLSVARGATVRGAGPWYSVIDAIDPAHALFNGEGQTGTFVVSGLAAFGQVDHRDDNQASNFFHGVLGPGGRVSDVWAQNFKAGLWLMGAGNTDVVIENNRFLDFLADGVNFNGSVKNGLVRNNYLRNQGDDALAVWSIHDPVEGARFTGNTIIAPDLANGIGIYGGIGTTIDANRITDTNVLGSGIALSNQEFGGAGFQPLAGTITVSGNHLVRTGQINPNWNHPMGAIRVDSFDHPVGDGVQITLTGNTYTDSPYGVIEFVSGGGKQLPISNVAVDGDTVDGAGTVVVQAETGGSATFRNVTATGVGRAGVYNCSGFRIVSGGGNSGWDSTWSGCAWP
jgi:hypothetical protein